MPTESAGARELRRRIAREICNTLSRHYSGGEGSDKDAWHFIARDDMVAKPYLLAADRVIALLPAALERMEALEALEMTRDGLRLDSELHLMLLNDDGKLTRAERDLLKRARDALTDFLAPQPGEGGEHG